MGSCTQPQRRGFETIRAIALVHMGGAVSKHDGNAVVPAPNALADVGPAKEQSVKAIVQKDASPRHEPDESSPKFQNMTEADINKMLGAYTDTSLELSLAREADFIGFLAQHNLPPFDEIPTQVYHLTHLKELNFSHNHIKSLDSSICELQQLEVLDLSSNQLKELPTSLCKLSRLTTLLVSENQLQCLPDDFGSCVALTKLICFKNQLTTLPDSIGGCIGLEEINLFNNKLTNLGTGFYDLGNLAEVNIAGNALTQLEPFTKLVKLKRCAAYLNKIKVFPSLTYCKDLVQVQLYRNALKELPDMSDLPNLTELDANTNQIRQIPDTLCSTTSALRNLNLRKNRLLSLPPVIGNLQKLEILNIGGNPISSPIPSEMESMKCIVSLLLDDSNITTLPQQMIVMRTLVRVDLGSRIDHNDKVTHDVIEKLENICTGNKGWLKQS
ncbi:Aste57867_326 [Aphanomyces stellatus]|uniref:Aste57867_326 protein n=1 Tax=Aphanomyces stellatus TaxID=120398 RepID=A0A485K6H1_9STRA|nr:hypothetical protein As57867_000326 [Aphanomyces stellatus]VFT77552.1 Aste57867_326 [Aphanomyces stellatus]